MKKNIFMLILAMGSVYFYLVDAQKIVHYRKETPQNAKERKEMLNLLRADLKKNYKQDFIFEVLEFRVSSNGYAWLEVDVRGKDGKEVAVDEMVDCCHAEALFRKKGRKWQIVESEAFSMDVWWDGIWDRIKGVPKSLFGK